MRTRIIFCISCKHDHVENNLPSGILFSESFIYVINSSRTHVRLGAWFWSAKADIFFSESLHIHAERLSQSEIVLPLRKTCFYSPLAEVGVFSTEIKNLWQRLLHHRSQKSTFFYYLFLPQHFLYFLPLPQWKEILSEEKLKQLYTEQKKSGTVVKETKVYPNDPCPCGSGKKYKKCCGRNK